MEENIYDPAPGPEKKQMTVSEEDKLYLKQGGTWARFIAIMMFIGLGLGLLFMLLSVIVVAAAGVSPSDIYGNMYSNPMAAALYGKIFWPIMILAIIVMLVYFFPAFYLFRFGTRARKAAEGDDQEAMTESLRNMRNYFRFVGWFIIAMIAFYIVFIVCFFVLAFRMASMM